MLITGSVSLYAVLTYFYAVGKHFLHIFMLDCELHIYFAYTAVNNTLSLSSDYIVVEWNGVGYTKLHFCAPQIVFLATV